jgi:hypothetical protein
VVDDRLRVVGADRAAAVALHVLGQRGRSGLLRQRGKLALGWVVADDEPRAALAQRSVEIAQAVEQELRSRTGGVAAVDQPVVEDEDGQQSIGMRARRRGREGQSIAGRGETRGSRSPSAWNYEARRRSDLFIWLGFRPQTAGSS